MILLTVESLQVEAYLFKKISYSLGFALVYSALSESAIGVVEVLLKQCVLKGSRRIKVGPMGGTLGRLVRN